MNSKFLKNFLLYFLFIEIICDENKINLEEIITLNKTNTIFINDEINEDSISKAIYKLTHMKEDNIYIYIDSFGGNIKHGNRFIEVIEYFSKIKKIYCIASYAASMAFIILQKCPYRYATKTSILMQHNIKVSLVNNEKNNIKNYIEYVDNIENYLIEQQITRLKMEKEKFIELVKNDWWITGSQALNKNVVDKLVIVGCDTNIEDTFELVNYEKINNNMIKITKIYSICPLIKNPISIVYNQV